MKQILTLLLMSLSLITNAQQWSIEYVAEDGDFFPSVGEMSAIYNYVLGYRNDTSCDSHYPFALCVDYNGNYIDKLFDRDMKRGEFNSVVSLNDGNVFVTAICTNNDDSEFFESLWMAILDPQLNVLHESYVNVEQPYKSFGEEAHTLINNNGEFVVVITVTEDLPDYFAHYDLVFYKLDGQCDLLGYSYMENVSYVCNLNDFTLIPDTDCYALFGNLIYPTGAAAITYIDKDFNYINSVPFDNMYTFPNLIRPELMSIGRWYDKNTFMMALQSPYTLTDTKRTAMALKVYTDVNDDVRILDSIRLERDDKTDYVSYKKCIAYIDENTIYMSAYELEDLYNPIPNVAMLYLLNDNLELLGVKTFDMDAFFEILNIQQTYDGGCIIQGLIIDAITTKAIIMKINKNEIMMNTEIHDDNDNLFVEAYPNPVSSVLNIDIENLICDEAMIEIFDISGRRCMQNKIVPESNLLSLDLSSLDRGIYNYKIIINDKILLFDTFVKE